MSVLGIKVSPSLLWYAIATGTQETPSFINLKADFRVPFPKAISNSNEKVVYLFNETISILERNKGIKLIVIKENEFTKFSEKSTNRFSSNLDGVIMAVGAAKGIPVKKILYASLGIKKAQLLQTAAALAGATEKYWGEDVADVILAAKSGL